MPAQPTLLLKTGWSYRNIGDIGFTPGTLAILQRYLPGVRVIAWMTRMNDAVEAMIRRRFPDVAIVRGGITAEDEPDTDDLRVAFDRCDLVLHNTSMGESPAMMRAARKRGKPYGMFGQSYFPSIRERGDVLDVLHDARFVYCRDTLTLETLRDTGIQPLVLDFNPDGCFGVDVRDDAAAAAYLEAKDLTPGRFMTVQLRTNTPKNPGGEAPTDPTIKALNPEEPTPQEQADDQRRAAVLRELMVGWIEKTGNKVLIAPEVEKEIPHNKRLLFDPLPAELRERVVVRETFWNTDEAAAIFGRAGLVLCHEPHSCILAMAQGTPIIHAYSPFHGPKYHMFADIGVPEWLAAIDETPPADILGRMLTIHHDPLAAREKVQQTMASIHHRLVGACRVIESAMNA